jgi:hypothetical protein
VAYYKVIPKCGMTQEILTLRIVCLTTHCFIWVTDDNTGTCGFCR